MKIFNLKAKSIVSAFLFYTLILMANQTAFSQYVCQPSGAPIVQTGSLTAGDATQAGRVVRGGIPSTCNGKSNTLQNTTAVNQDNYTFNAPVTGCATVEFDATQCGGATTQAVAYSTYDPAAPATNVIGDFGFSTTAVATFSFPVTAGQNFTVVVHDIIEAPNVLCANYTFTIKYRTSCQQPGFDRNNDGSADAAVFTPGTQGTFTNTNLMNNVSETRPFGQTNDVPVPADYNGDGLTELAVYRPSTNFFYKALSQTNTMTNFNGFPYGSPNDVFIPGDYDGDGTADVAVWRPSNGFWFAMQSSTNTLLSVQWGRSGDIPITGDFDGDLKTDFVVVRPNAPGETNYIWYVLHSNFARGFALFTRWGGAGDIPLAGDFDGNGKSDITVFRPSNGTWYSILSNRTDAVGTTFQYGVWGQAGDVPQPADYDGDGKVDYAVFRPNATTSAFYALNSSNAVVQAVGIGSLTSVPVTAPYPIRSTAP